MGKWEIGNYEGGGSSCPRAILTQKNTILKIRRRNTLSSCMSLSSNKNKNSQE
jgi:hypothetical protein